MDPLRWMPHLRTPNARHLHISFNVTGEGAPAIRAARILVDSATDDTGRELRNDSEPKFYTPSVGRTSGADLQGPPPVSIATTLTESDPAASMIRQLRGRVQMVVPEMNPDATVVIEDLASKLGQRIAAGSLDKARVTLYVFGPGQAKAAAETTGIKNLSFGEQHLSAAQIAQLPAAERAMLLSPPIPEIGPQEILLAVSDPEGLLIGAFFVAADGSPLTYNRNGSSHLESQGWRLSTYRLDRPVSAGLKLVCWLVLDGTILEMPLTFTDVILPPWTAPFRPVQAKPESDQPAPAKQAGQPPEGQIHPQSE